jgi:hypothetical protein
MQLIDYVTRQLIIAEAKTWLGTSFHHQGRIKASYGHKGGCDCLGLIMGIAKALNLRSITGQLIIDYDCLNYSVVAGGKQLASHLSLHLLDRGNDLGVAELGDIALFVFARNFQHLALINWQEYGDKKYLSLIHAYLPAGMVCQHRLDHRWQQRLCRIYSFSLMP